MTTNQYPHRVVLLSSSFKYPNRWLFFSRARLFLDRIELSGWHFGKRHEQWIAFDELDKVEWDTDASNAVFHLSEGKQVKLQLPEMDRWKQSLEQRLRWSAPSRMPMAHYCSNTTRPDLPLQDVINFTTAMG